MKGLKFVAFITLSFLIFVWPILTGEEAPTSLGYNGRATRSCFKVLDKYREDWQLHNLDYTSRAKPSHKHKHREEDQQPHNLNEGSAKAEEEHELIKQKGKFH